MLELDIHIICANSPQAKQAEIVSTQQPSQCPIYLLLRGAEVFSAPLSNRRNVSASSKGDISILENKGHFTFGLTASHSFEL
jgi:hypothetical protein